MSLRIIISHQQSVINHHSSVISHQSSAITAKNDDFADENFDRKTVSSKTRYAPKAFTERGLYMLSTILKSEQAIGMNVKIVS